jgi:signal transduction histidine kinase
MFARLDEAFQRERQFTTDASHELRTPLATLQTILSVIRAERRSPEDYEQALADIAEEVNRLRSLVEDLLRLAQQDLQPGIAHERVDVVNLLAGVTDALRPLAESKGVQLTLTAPTALTLDGDSDSLIRLFVNLVENAIKYTQQGRIAVTARATVDRFWVTVADTGSGIPAAHLPHIFNRFYRVDPARTTQGTGLGLAIALDIVQAHGGTITVESVVDHGTTFTVQLPVSSKPGLL